MSDKNFKIVKLLDPITLNISGPNFTGAYDNGTSYAIGDSVSYNGSSYVALLATTGNLPTNTTYWQLLASIGDTGPTGADGADGNTILEGAGAPSSGLGVDGDFYIDTSTYEIYGPKTAGAWGTGTSLIGPPGSSTVTGNANTIAFYDGTGNISSNARLSYDQTTDDMAFYINGNGPWISQASLYTIGLGDILGTVNSTSINIIDSSSSIYFRGKFSNGSVGAFFDFFGGSTHGIISLGDVASTSSGTLYESNDTNKTHKFKNELISGGSIDETLYIGQGIWALGDVNEGSSLPLFKLNANTGTGYIKLKNTAGAYPRVLNMEPSKISIGDTDGVGNSNFFVIDDDINQTTIYQQNAASTPAPVYQSTDGDTIIGDVNEIANKTRYTILDSTQTHDFYGKVSVSTTGRVASFVAGVNKIGDVDTVANSTLLTVDGPNKRITLNAENVLAPLILQQSPSVSYAQLVWDTASGSVRRAPAITGLQPVLDNTLATPPGSPNVGDAYIVASSPTGAWVGHVNEIATWGGSTWSFYTPTTGDQTTVTTGTNAGKTYNYSGTAWVLVASSSSGQWSLGGNSLTAIQTLGTNSVHALPIVTSGIERARFETSGDFLLGTTTSLARQTIRSRGTTSATHALWIQNSAGATRFTVRDDGETEITGSLRFNSSQLVISPASNTCSITAPGNYRIVGGAGDLFAYGGVNHCITFFGTWTSGLPTSGTKVLSVATGTAPTTNLTDCYQFYSSDQAAGNACPTFRTENGSVLRLSQATGGAATAGATYTSTEQTMLQKVYDHMRTMGMLT